MKVMLIEKCGECRHFFGNPTIGGQCSNEKHPRNTNIQCAFDYVPVNPARLDPDCPLPNLSDIQPFWDGAEDEPDYGSDWRCYGDKK